VADTYGAGQYGGVYWTNSPVILNAIVYNNTGGIENDILPVVNGVSGVTYSCAPSLTSGTGNITADPLFTASGSGSGTTFTAGDYRPVIGGPCAGTGLVAGWMGAAVELAGLSRLRSGQVDMGAYAAILPVSTYVATNGSDSATGSSWSDPFLTIQKGINAATPLGTVSVSNGTYVLTSPLLLDRGCSVIGVGGASNTTIDANMTGRILSISNSAAVVDGFTLKNGKSTSGSMDGTGVNMTGGTLRNCIVSGCTNTAGWVTVRGVGIYMTGGTVDTCVVNNNGANNSSSYNYGGGLYLAGASCLVTNCVISGNSLYNADQYAYASGGGLYVSAGNVLGCVVSNNTIDQGRRIGGGGGVYVTGGSISNCTISGNAVLNVDTRTWGGGVYASGGTVVGCTISNNHARGWSAVSYAMGGGLYMTNALVDRCVITRNYLVNSWEASRYGGGVACDGGVMRNCLIMGNRGNSLGGGLYITGGTNENCTIVRNACVADAYGVGQYGGVYWTNNPVILNAIVYNNTGGVENDIAPVMYGVSGVTYSCGPSLSSGTGNITADPLFTASGSGSGTNFTAGDYRLAAGSPCVDKGLTEAWMNTATDLDNLRRVYGFLVDMGAYEDRTSRGTVFIIR
jgi:hypothetical protein